MNNMIEIKTPFVADTRCMNLSFYTRRLYLLG